MRHSGPRRCTLLGGVSDDVDGHRAGIPGHRSEIGVCGIYIFSIKRVVLLDYRIFLPYVGSMSLRVPLVRRRYVDYLRLTGGLCRL